MSSSQHFTPAERIGMFKLTWPYVKSELVRHWRLIALLVVMSVLLGFVPTIKSELEAGLIDEIGRTINNPRSTTPVIDRMFREGPPVSFTEAVLNVLNLPLSRFESGRSNDGIPERVASVLFGKVSVGVALLIYLGVSISAYAVDFLTTVLQTRVSREVFAKLRGIGLTKGLVVDPSRLPAASNVAGQYSSAIQIGALNVGNTYGYLLDAGQHFLSLGTALLLVFTTSRAFAVACLAIVLLQVWLSYAQGRKLRRQRNELDARRNDLVARTDDVLSKREIILAYERQQDYGKKLERYTRGFADVARSLDLKEKLYSLMSRLITDYGRMLILLVGLLLTLAIAHSGLISQVSGIGDAYFFISIYTRILIPATDLLRKYDSLKEAESTSRTFLAVLNPDLSDVGGALVAQHQSKQPESVPERSIVANGNAVTFQDVYFNYPPAPGIPSNAVEENERRFVLNGVTLRIPLRKTTLVLGRSGCGKTTIARILLGFWRPDRGEVRVLGRVLSEYSGDELRSLMAYVSQGDHIVDDTVRENLSWGYTRDGEAITDERMLQALEELQIIRTTQEREAILDRFARDLSGGQQQRLSFARMMLDQSDIVILDEPFAGVDIFTLREIRPILRRIMVKADQTVLMFSHRLAFANFADHVVVFGDNGSIIEEGSPIELLKRNGEFAKLYNEARAELILDSVQEN